MKQPYDENGRQVPCICPNPDCSGYLQYQGNSLWTCDGLVDPNDLNKELQPCDFSHTDGQPYNATIERYNERTTKRGVRTVHY